MPEQSSTLERDERRNRISSDSSWYGAAIGGTLLGLLIGLLIGWVFWPVSWTNVSLVDLAQADKAQYLGAVADAYAAAQDQPALALADQRLHMFETDTRRQELVDAISWFEVNAPDDGAVHATNLRVLADALQVDLIVTAESGPGTDTVAGGQDAADTGAGLTPVPTALVIVPDVTAVTTPGEPVNGQYGWFRWFLSVAAALLLITGGLFVLRQLFDRRAAVPAIRGAGQVADVDAGDAGSGAAGFAREAGGDTYVDVDAQLEERARLEAARRQTGDVMSGGDGDDYSFQAEPLPMPSAGTVTVPIRDDVDHAADVGRATPADMYDDDGFFDGDDEEMIEGQWQQIEPGEPVALAGERTQAGTSIDTDTQPSDVPPLSGRVIDTFEAHYQYGVPDYDQEFSILDGVPKEYVGGCGMGINMKKRIVGDNPDTAAAIDVWLFDKVNERDIDTKTCILVGESLADRRDLINDESNQVLVAQPGRQFQLVANYLLLDCEITRVSFADDANLPGVFRELLVRMTVRRIR